jgi:NAD(P)-dependent dehydrogenase (short-subunit alcohol dehydrogenase family)
MKAPIGSRLHGAVDYVTGASLVGTALVPGLRNRFAGRVLAAAGATHLAYSAFTDYELGAVRKLPYRAHLALDALAAAGLIGAGASRGNVIDRLAPVGVGAFELAAVAMSDPEGDGARRVKDLVVVITGAASGIGRVTARRFAEKGAQVVVTARRNEALDELVAELGPERALAVSADVTDEAQLRAVAEQAVARFGRIDVWVNCAAVTLFSRFEDAPRDEYRAVLDTNVLGYMNGAWAALPHLRRSRGTLINVGSVNSYVPAPQLSAYIASKHAVRGWAGSLRQELRGTGVDVVTILPGSIDTPLFQQGANHTGRKAKALDPTNPPERVARAILRAARRPMREKAVGRGSRQMLLFEKLVPGPFERLMARKGERDQFADEPAQDTSGNLFAPDPQQARETGGWRRSDGEPVDVEHAMDGSAGADQAHGR